MSKDLSRQELLENTIDAALDKCGSVGSALKSIMRGGFSTAGQVAEGFGNTMLGRSRTAAGELVGKGELKKRISKATGHEAASMQRQLDAARFKQLVVGGGLAYGSARAAGGATQSYDGYMRRTYGTP